MKKYSSLKELLDNGGKVAFPEQIFISPGKDTKKEFRKPRPMWLPDNPDNVRLFAESSSLLGLSKERFFRRDNN